METGIWCWTLKKTLKVIEEHNNEKAFVQQKIEGPELSDLRRIQHLENQATPGSNQ